MFKEFAPTNKAEWLDKIEKDINKRLSKDDQKSVSHLNWTINEALSISPFATEEDTKEIDYSILEKYHPDWQVGEVVNVKNYQQANKRALEILMKGVDAITFHFYKIPTQQDFDSLFENIGIEYIAVHFTFENEEFDIEQFYSLYVALLEKRKLSSTKGSFAFPFQEKKIASLLKKNSDFAHELISINAKKFYQGDKLVIKELSQTIQAAKNCFEKLIAENISPEQIAQQTFFTVAIGKSFLLQIAKLRALKLLWVDLLKSYSLTPNLPFLKVVFSSDSYGDSKHDNLINASTLAMSAVCGGANHLIVNPDFSKDGAPTSSDFRLARNVQLLLKHESGFHQVADPANGSYYIELLTSQLIAAANTTN